MQRARAVLLLVARVLFGAGAASAVTALATYFTRYSTFDSIEGEASFEVYVAITRMAAVEQTELVVGVLVILAIMLLVASRIRLSGQAA